MIYFIIICINLLPSEFNLNRLERISMNSPVLINFHLKNFNVSDSWTIFSSDMHRENSSINCALIHCKRNNEICQRFSVTEPFTYLTIYRKYYQIHKLTDDSIEGLTELYKKSLADPLTYCQNYFIPSDNNISFKYPTFVLNYFDNSACLDLSKYKVMYPNIDFYLRKPNTAQPNNHLKIELCNSPSKCYHNTRFYDTMNFIDEFIPNHFGNWSITAVSHIKRRLVLIVYDDDEKELKNNTVMVKNRPKRSDFEHYIGIFQSHFLFGSVPFSFFSSSVGQLRSASDCPFMLITNVKKNRFMIVDYGRLNYNQIYDKLNSARQGFLELQMSYFFDSKYAMEHQFNPKNVKQFALAAFCVVAFTAFLILWKAYLCINMFDNLKYKSNISL